jgi:hypothetical protein
MRDEEIISRFRDAAALLDLGTPPAEVADYLRATANRLELEREADEILELARGSA